ncbi:MAG: biopolymer transporter ExbD [Burkholderiaceae bacterium]
MNFRRQRAPEEPEINFIPLIDLLLVILIFLMVSTTFSRYTQLKVDLPSASSERSAEQSDDIVVAVSADGQYRLAKGAAEPLSLSALVAQLRSRAAQDEKSMVIIYADAGASHQSVIGVLDAARQAGLERVTFAAQSESSGR